MLYRTAADLVVAVHLLFVLFVVLGGLLALRWRRVAWLHLPAAIWGTMIEFAGWVCPLTPLEKHLRTLGGEQGYAGGFIQNYMIPLLYPEGLTRRAQVVLGAVVVLLNVAVYAAVLMQARRARTRAPSR